MGGRIATRHLLVGLTVVLVLAGCSAGSAPVPTATGTPAPAGSPTTSQSPSATAVHYGPVTAVSGTATCPTHDLGTATAGGGGLQHYLGGTFKCTLATSDPRVSGMETASVWNFDLWGTTANGAGVQWGAVRLESADGAWEGKGSGVYSSDRGDIIVSWHKGTGNYAGLVYFEMWTGKSPWNIRGQIFTGDLPGPMGPPPTAATPTPTAAAGPTTSPAPPPTAIAYGPVSVAEGSYRFATMDLGSITSGTDGLTRYSGGIATGVETVTDPRASFTFTGSPWTILVWGTIDDGAGIQWGQSRSENAGGWWLCTGTGIYDGRGDTIVNWCKGMGGHAGLAYFEVDTSMDPFGMIKPNGADGTIHSEIFPGEPPTP